MRVLAIETATEACSVALFDDGACLDHFHAVIGRGHAEALVPAIAALPGKGRADRILVSLGPGSFTGVRIGLAAARALGLAWQAEVLGYPTMALVAAMARKQGGSQLADQAVTVSMTGGHGEWFVQRFDAQGLPLADVASLTPAQARAAHDGGLVAGSKAVEMAGEEGTVLDLLPDARAALLVPGSLVTPALAPIYGRPPDARPQTQVARR